MISSHCDLWFVIYVRRHSVWWMLYHFSQPSSDDSLKAPLKSFALTHLIPPSICFPTLAYILEKKKQFQNFGEKTALKFNLCHANNFAFLTFQLNAEVEVSFSRDQQRSVYGDVKCPTACPVSGTILFRETFFGFCCSRKFSLLDCFVGSMDRGCTFPLY